MIFNAPHRCAPPNEVRETPLLWAPGIDALAGRRVLVKAECLQLTGSFKFRGGLVRRLRSRSRGTGERGVIAFKSGNHAQGVALAAQMHGVPCRRASCPATHPGPRSTGTRALQVPKSCFTTARTTRIAMPWERPVSTRAVLSLIRPYDDPQVIAGQGHGRDRDCGTGTGDGRDTGGCAGVLRRWRPDLGHRTGARYRSPGSRARSPWNPRDLTTSPRSLAAGRVRRGPSTPVGVNLRRHRHSLRPGEIAFP